MWLRMELANLGFLAEGDCLLHVLVAGEIQFPHVFCLHKEGAGAPSGRVG